MMWTNTRDARASEWLSLGKGHHATTTRTVESVRALVTAARRRQRHDGTMPPVPLSEVADMIVRAAQATVRAGLKGQMDAAARDAAARVDTLGDALGLEISDSYREIAKDINSRPPPPQGATHQLHREIIAACPCLTAFFEVVGDWGPLAAQMVGSGDMVAPPNLDGSPSSRQEDQGSIASPAARGRWGAVRAWRRQGAALLTACEEKIN